AGQDCATPVRGRSNRDASWARTVHERDVVEGTTTSAERAGARLRNGAAARRISPSEPAVGCIGIRGIKAAHYHLIRRRSAGGRQAEVRHARAAIERRRDGEVDRPAL